MAKISILIALLPHLIYTMVHGTTPCSEYFTYIIDPETRNILGQVSIPPPPENDEFYLKVALNTTTDLLRGIFRLELARSIKGSIQAVQQGRSLLYHVYFPSHENFPMISAIWFNDQLYCLGPEVSIGNIEATIELGHIVYQPYEEQLSQNFQPWHRNSSSYRIDNPSYNDNNNNECGITSYYTDSTNSMIPNGENTLPGQWPWTVAVFRIERENRFTRRYLFQCSGTILSDRHVLTAAHCLNNIADGAIPSIKLEVILGQFNLDQLSEERTVIRGVASYKIHPNYADTSSGDSDLAVLILKRPIEFNPFVRPICLWSGPITLRYVVGRTGYVAGWGINAVGRRNFEQQAMVKVSIVSQETCISSHPAFAHITSQNTLCAGSLDMSGPCSGDSGSGLVLFDKTTDRYELRGTVSHSIFNPNSPNLCDNNKYIVYVDVAKYKAWIQQQISTT